MTVEPVYKQWSNAQLYFFLSLRNIKIDSYDLTREELLELVESKKSTPIVNVKITPHLISQLTHVHLITYLTQVRGYVVLPKGKSLAIHPTGSGNQAKEAYAFAFKWALDDYEENVKSFDANEEEASQFKLGEVLSTPYGVQNKETISLTEIHSFDYPAFGLDEAYLALTKFGVYGEEPSIKDADLETKVQLTRQSVNFLSTGKLV